MGVAEMGCKGKAKRRAAGGHIEGLIKLAIVIIELAIVIIGLIRVLLTP
jgi:hypothetical protein